MQVSISYVVVEILRSAQDDISITNRGFASSYQLPTTNLPHPYQLIAG